MDEGEYLQRSNYCKLILPVYPDMLSLVSTQ